MNFNDIANTLGAFLGHFFVYTRIPPLPTERNAMPKQYDREVMENGRVIIFCRSDPAKAKKHHPKWWVKFSIPRPDSNTHQIWDEPLGTRDKNEAIRVAGNRYDEAKDRIKLGVETKAPSIERIIDEYMEEKRRHFEEGKISKTHLTSLNNSTKVLRDEIFSGNFWPRIQSFEDTRKHIDKIRKHVEKRREKNNLMTDGKRRETQLKNILKQLWKFSIDKRYANERLMPNDRDFDFPKQNPRKTKSFSDKEITFILRMIPEWITEPLNNNDVWSPYYRPLLGYYLYCLTYSGIRTSEARRLQWDDIYLVDPKDGANVANIRDCKRSLHSDWIVQIDIPANKAKTKRDRLVTCLQDYTHKAFDHYEWAQFKKDDDYLFATLPEGKPIHSFFSTFNNFMEFAAKEWKQLFGTDGVTYDDEGNKRNTYTFRHTYINRQIDRRTINIQELAENAGHRIDTMMEWYRERRGRGKEQIESVRALAGVDALGDNDQIKKETLSTPSDQTRESAELRKQLSESERKIALLEIKIIELAGEN